MKLFFSVGRVNNEDVLTIVLLTMINKINTRFSL